MTVSVKLNLRGLLRARSGSDDAIDRGAKRAAEFVGDLAQQLAPVDEGDLKASMRVRKGETPTSYRVSFGAPSTGVDYAVYVEYGTYDSPAQPFLTPALREIDVKAEIAKELRDLVSG